MNLRIMKTLTYSALLTAAMSLNLTSFTWAEPTHSLAMHGTAALPADYQYFPYVNPDAPKGGQVRYGVVGTFDSLNPFVLKSMRTTARGLFMDGDFGNLVYESLMQRSRDEAFALYGLLAEKVESDEDRHWVEFTLNPLAKWSDGEPVTIEDVIFTYELLTEKGRPPYSSRMSRIEKIEKTGERKVRFTFNDQSDREFPLLIASTMPVLPRHAIDVDSFGNASLKAPVGSGPYKVARVSPGQSILYERNDDYWAKDLPVKRGFDNFDKISIEYFRNETAMFEAFKKGVVDVFLEGNPTRWQTSYNFPAVKDGRIIKAGFSRGIPVNLLGFTFNTRREIFADSQVRHAISLLFDFEWANRSLFSDQYKRTEGYWFGSNLSAVGIKADERERSLLALFPNAVRSDVMEGKWHASRTDGSGHDRKLVREAMRLLKQAGFRFEKGKAIGKDGKPFEFEIMTRSVDEEKVSLAFKRNLERLGIEVSVRTVDDAQYQHRMQTYDYDMMLGALTGTLSPGNEQWNRWGSASRDAQGSFNYAGAADPAIDAMIEAMLAARSQEDFVSAVRAMDRVLISGDYYVPLYHLPQQWLAHWGRVKYPEKTSLFGYQLPTWWAEDATK
ncbi:Oligopeptide-binding protein AppA [Paenochrobactrum sp. BZR 201-1]